MKNIYLVQRARIKNLQKSGKLVKEYFGLDYMGAAEFEFGAVGDFYRSFADITPVKMQVFMPRRQKLLHVLGDVDKDYLNQLIQIEQGMQRLKERIGLTWDAYWSKQPNQDDFWMDIENNVVFSFNLNAINRFNEAVHKSVEYMKAKV